jgi:hypothetical protein
MVAVEGGWGCGDRKKTTTPNGKPDGPFGLGAAGGIPK